MNILLIQPPHYYEGGNRPPTFFPLGLGYVAQALLKSEHHVDILDIWAHQWTDEEVSRQLMNLDSYELIGISALSTQYSYIKWLTRELRRKSPAKIMVGGALATHSPDLVLRHTSADICVIGEGEVTVKDITENLYALEKVAGIAFKNNGNITHNPPRPYIQNLDDIEFPGWDIFPIDIYLNNCSVFGFPHIKAMNLITSRGCPWDCNFCSKTFTKVRFRTIDNVIAEIKELKRKFNIEGIGFMDELLVSSKKRFYELCNKIEPLHIRWSCQGRVNLVTLEMLKRMKRAGCVAIGYGIESGSATILSAMNKKITPSQVDEALRNTVKAKIIPVVQLMYGYPGENKKTLEETVNLFKNTAFLGQKALQFIQLSPTVPLPGSALYQQAIKEGLITNEDEFLSQLSAGYMPEVRKLLVNFTQFNEHEFWQRKEQTEKKIVTEQRKKHPVRAAVDFFLFKISQLHSYYKKFGLKKTSKALALKLMHRSVGS